MANRGNRRGFTLVEILVAFAILALTLAAVMQALSGGLRILSTSDAHSIALRIAETRLAEAGRSMPLESSVETGEDGRYRWRLEITPYDGKAGPGSAIPSAYTVRVSVSWGGGRNLTLSTVKLGPPADE